MARIIYSAIVTSIRGSIGGTTFQQNAFGFSVKNKPAMSRVGSIRQHEQRRRLNYVAQGWLSISDANRASWSAWALAHPVASKHNPSSILSGYQYFLKYNLIHTMFVSTFLAAPNPGTLVLPNIAPIITLSAGVLSINLLPVSDVLAIFGNLYLSAPQKKSHTFSSSFTRAIIVKDFTTGLYDITSFYLAVFGILPSIGDTIFFEVQPFGGSIPYIFASQYFTVIVS
jgi:hypothetical protein